MKVQPFKTKIEISKIKNILKRQSDPRDYAIFIFGISCGLRASDLCQITYGQVKDVEVGGNFTVLEQKQESARLTRIKKTGKHVPPRYRRIVMTKSMFRVLEKLCAYYTYTDDAPLFRGRFGAIKPQTIYGLVKNWAKMAGLKNRYGSHSLRKTFGVLLRTQTNASLQQLMRIFGHATELQTAQYLCLDDDELDDLVLSVEI